MSLKTALERHCHSLPGRVRETLNAANFAHVPKEHSAFSQVCMCVAMKSWVWEHHTCGTCAGNGMCPSGNLEG